MRPKILIIDDDKDLLGILTTGLAHQGFETFAASSGPEGLRAAFANHPDLVVLDVMMPAMDGLEVCRRLRELSDTPMIMLTALSETPSIVRGLSAGADDYMCKPFRMEELVARIQAVLRRKSGGGAPSDQTVMGTGDLTIDFARHRVTVRGSPVDLTPTEFRLLSYLAHRPGQVIPHRTLLTEIWGAEYGNQTDYLHLYIRYLRQKIERNPSRPNIIKTERGIGYFFEGQ